VRTGEGHLEPADNPGRRELDRIGFRTLDRWTTIDAGLGSRTDERGPHDGLARRSGGRWSHLGRGGGFLGPRCDAGGRRISFGGQSGVSDPAFDQLRPTPRTGSKTARSGTRVSVGAEGGGGPVTVTVELIIRPEDREEFLALIGQLRLIFLRNGAFLYRVDEFSSIPALSGPKCGSTLGQSTSGSTPA
jgi:hypothetical protein